MGIEMSIKEGFNRGRERVSEFNIHFPVKAEGALRLLLEGGFKDWPERYQDRFVTLVTEVAYIAGASRWYYKEEELRLEDFFAFLGPIASFVNSWKHE